MSSKVTKNWGAGEEGAKEGQGSQTREEKELLVNINSQVDAVDSSGQ